MSFLACTRLYYAPGRDYTMCMDIAITLKELGVYESYCECLRECVKLNDRRFGPDNDFSKRNAKELRRFMQRQRVLVDFVNEIPDPEIRKIIKLRFQKRYHWNKVNRLVYGYPDYCYSRIRFNRYFKKNADKVAELEEALSRCTGA